MVAFGEFFELVSVVIIFGEQLLVFLIESHVLLVLPLDLLVVAHALGLHLLDPFAVPLFLDIFDLADPFLDKLPILSE